MAEELRSEQWQEKVLDASKPVLVDFFASWCGPCKMMSPIVDEIATEMAGKAEVFKINIDDNPDIAQRYEVMSIPTFIVFKDGKAHVKTLGAQEKESIRALFD